ncbi:type II secretion system minor pseudopilin GspJ [Thalassotalea sp. G2M2-11]|uniref:type II secretion system minor pseudopilin GspJ n=1 Tax=Thalassotalea sp. G2M2-11 TaxID=2787627 RepID=UPI0019D1747D|nr:type II secretion system minor pseudopilin GspJ [Thalassotalea sp. G2M2-11]
MIRARQLRLAVGFTLIEVLLAVSIFAMISLASFSIFDGVMRSEQSSQDKIERINALQNTFMVIERDFLQISQRSIRMDGEAPSSDFIYTSNNSYSLSEQAIAFVRAGWTNPGLLIPRSDLQSVAYQLKDNQLQRLHYNFVDAVVGEKPKVRVLIDHVSSMALQFFYDNKWQEKPIAGRLPRAISLTLELDDLGEIERKFLVAEQAGVKS